MADMRSAPSTPTQRAVSLWRNRDYLLLWGGQAISNIGGGVTQIAWPLLTLAVTRSPAQAGFVGAVRALTYALLVLPAGALLDRWDRKRAMILCDSGRALALASIPLALAFSHLTLAQIYIATLVEGALNVFFDVAEVSSLPQVVKPEQLPAAMARNQATTGLTVLLGPPLGGLLFALGEGLPFLADALSYAVSVASLLLIRVPFQQQRAPLSQLPSPRGSGAGGEVQREVRALVAEVREGLRWLWRQPLIRPMALLTGASNAFGAGYALIVIVFAQRQHASDATIGLIFGVGGILGALLAEWVVTRLRFAWIVLGSLWLFAIFWSLLIIWPTPLGMGIATALIFFAAPFYNVAYVSRRLALIPDALQSRVNSVARLIAFGAAPIGVAITGVLLQRIGPTPTVIAFVAGQVAVALVALLVPAIRHE